MRRLVILLILALLLAASGVTFLILRARKPPAGEAYVGERHVALWSSTAQVRQQLATLGYGEEVTVLQRFGSKVEIRARKGLTGWVDEDQLITRDAWDRIGTLVKQAQKIPAQARGHTRVLGNLHLEPGRETARIGQLPRDAAVEVLERAVASAPAAAGPAAKGESSSNEEAAPRREGWLLVRADLPDHEQAGGWLLERFVQYDMPDPLPEYASSAGMRVMAWLELNQVPDHAGPKPQYLVAGTKGAEDQPCDFTMLRVYTWGTRRERYETAYVENNLCGRLPIRVTPQANKDVLFEFPSMEGGQGQKITYRMRQTIVRRVTATTHRKSKKAKGKK